jgi:hypothetical protein
MPSAAALRCSVGWVGVGDAAPPPVPFFSDDVVEWFPDNTTETNNSRPSNEVEILLPPPATKQLEE